MAALSYSQQQSHTNSHYGGTYYDPTYSQTHLSTSRPYVTPSSSHGRVNTRLQRRDPTRERSKKNWYTVVNGTHGNDVYSSLRIAAPYCWNHETQFFFDGCICKGFDTYDAAWDWILGITHSSEPP